MKLRLQRIAGLFLSLFILVLNPPAGFGIILHPEREPNLTEWTDRPCEDVVGRWGENASCVVVAPNYIITTRHQGGGTSTAVVIGGETYSIEEIWNHPDDPYPSDPNYRIVDLRVVRLHNAYLENYVDVYAEPNELNEPNYMCIGGYGLGREGPLDTNGVVYGYEWQDREVYKNYNQRWCTNIIDETINSALSGSYHVAAVVADFDGPNSLIDDPNATIYEGSVAEFDSGCGWFIKSDGNWKVAGLTWAVDHAGIDEVWFREKDDPNTPDPDKLYAVRINSYAEWVNDKISVPADLTGDYWVDFVDFAVLASWWLDDCDEQNNWCQGADYEPTNGCADWNDLAFLVDSWLCDW